VNAFIRTITSAEPSERNRSFEGLCEGLSAAELLSVCDELDAFRRSTDNLYHRVRATLFLYGAHRFALMESPGIPRTGLIPQQAFEDLLARRFGQAIDRLLRAQRTEGPNSALSSALAESYHHSAFQSLVDQVRRSVRASRGNQWMFRTGHVDDHPVRVRQELLTRPEGSLLYPVLVERTPVRLDLSHSGWSDIFFLGMDYPEGARVLNISVDLGVYGRDESVRPPIEAYIRAIPEPVLRLTSVDLPATKDITDLQDLFNFGNDYLGLLKAGIIASGVVPPAFEGTGQSLPRLLARVVGPGMGLELVTNVNDIPKGSRLAVSTNLLACIVSALMRATGQTAELCGPLLEHERRLVASRAILGEWLGGSGGGWQDSGGLWPGLKIIQGTLAEPGDPEFGISLGCLLPRHRILGPEDLHPATAQRLADSVVLIHGGLAQNVGPILEMVTEKYLLRCRAEWEARQQMRGIFDSIVAALKAGDVRELARNTTCNWSGPLKTIIPWVTNAFTETLIARARQRLGDDFWGFLMLGGMSGGGMAMFVAPERHARFRDEVLEIMRGAKRELEASLPFAIDPLVYDFRVNEHGTMGSLLQGAEAMMPARYYALQTPELVRQHRDDLSYVRRAELDHFSTQCDQPGQAYGLLRTLVSNLFRVSDPASQGDRLAWDAEAAEIKRRNGFDPVLHEQLRTDLRQGRTGLAHNRLPVETEIRDVETGDVTALEACAAHGELGVQALREGRVAVMSLAAGVGTRWTSGAGVIKALSPFVLMAGQHRSFLEIHLRKTGQVSRSCGVAVPHIVSTSFLTHGSIAEHLERHGNHDYAGPVYLSPGRAIGQRMIPMVRDLVFLWEETAQETLDEQKQKVRDAVRAALVGWTREKGEGNDYVDNIPAQRLHPPGHWYEVPNLLRNGVLARLLAEHPQLTTIMLHNIDTLGADVDPSALGAHLASGDALTFEVVPRRTNDRGGGLARVNGRLRLLEGLAQPRDGDELRLSYYNSSTCWIEIDALLELFGLTRDDLRGPEDRLTEAVRRLAGRVPTYVTIKDVKWRWGHGQEDVYPTAQFEKLWGDMTALPDVHCGYLAVPRSRGQQLKDPSELDPWANDGSKAHVARLAGLEG